MKRYPCLLFLLFVFCMLLCGSPAHADWGIVDSLNIAPFVPIVLDAIMSVAMTGFDFFVGNGTGIIYMLIWAAVIMYVLLYLFKMWIPAPWLKMFGFSGGGQMYDKGIGGIQLGETLLKPAMRAIIAATILLPIRPQYVTSFFVDPFLRFGAIYTESITTGIFQNTNMASAAPQFECPPDIVEKGYMSGAACKFLVQPVSDITHANNQIIKRGLQFIDRGIRGMLTLIPHGGEDFLNIVTGFLLITTFVSLNFFMALLIIQGIFQFGMQLILYPFNVLKFVVKGKDDKWIDLWAAFGPLIESLKKLVITMIVCAIMLAINIAAVRGLFRWNTSMFVSAAGGTASSNVPTAISGGMGFGEHAVVWLSAILTFFLMQKIFKITQEKLTSYSGKNQLYDNVTGDARTLYGNTKKNLKTGVDLFKKVFK